MTKRDLVVKIANEIGLTQSDVATVIQMTLDGLADELASGGNIELRNFGVFEVVVKAAKKGRNPNNPQDEIIIPAHSAVRFRVGKELKAEVEKLNSKTLKK